MKSDAIQQCEICRNRHAIPRRHREAHQAVGDGVIRALDLGHAVQIDLSRLVGRVLHRFEKPANIAHQLKGCRGPIAGPDGLAGINRILESPGQIGQVQQEIIELAAAGDPESNKGFERRLLCVVPEPGIIQQILVVQRERPERVLEVLDAHLAPGQRLLDIGRERGIDHHVPAQAFDFWEEKIAHGK